MCVSVVAVENLYFKGRVTQKEKNTTERHIILLGLLSKRGLMCNTDRSLHVGIKISKPIPPPLVCVSLTRVSDCFQAADSSTTRETDPSVPSKEDIPTFDEWKKQVMEVEMEKSECVCH